MPSTLNEIIENHNKRNKRNDQRAIGLDGQPMVRHHEARRLPGKCAISARLLCQKPLPRHVHRLMRPTPEPPHEDDAAIFLWPDADMKRAMRGIKVQAIERGVFHNPPGNCQ
jgi:hypothetical protein